MYGFEGLGTKATQLARETAEKNREAAEESVRGAEQAYSTTFDNVRNLNVALIDAAQENAENACALARDIATSKTPSELVAVWTKYAQKQFDMATKHIGKFIALGQNFQLKSMAR